MSFVCCRAMPENVIHYPRVTVDGESVPVENLCDDPEGKGSKCRFKVDRPKHRIQKLIFLHFI